ncbi:hypothetical protein [Nonomuraea sp. SYSU D8015]|uniref:hypothetical protein n=1 Tax=Nonomuraea sp. SYSU D8015 TaxID=2593644 RepID=UPI00166087D3|nr:hypothetical protein [Nonomuraea sp. SYSU D8015]
MSLSRRQMFQATGATTAFSAAGQAAGTSPALAPLPRARSDIGVSAYEFDLGQVRLTSGATMPGTYAALTRSWASPPSSITRTSTSSLAFTATANGASVRLGPFYDAHDHNNVVYWNTGGQGGTGTASFRLVNAAGGPAFGGTSQGAQVVLADDNDANNNLWRLL